MLIHALTYWDQLFHQYKSNNKDTDTDIDIDIDISIDFDNDPILFLFLKGGYQHCKDYKD